MNFLLLILCSLLVLTMPTFAVRLLTETVYLAEGTSTEITANAYGSNVLRIFCYPGSSRSVFSLFETVELTLSIGSDDFSQYVGGTPEEVLQNYEDKRSLFSFTLLARKRQGIKLSPFEQQCIGITAKQPYNVRLVHTKWDSLRLVQITIGLLIIWSAGHLAKNSVFYYLTGIVVGICASFLILLAIVSKLFPKSPMMYAVLFGGGTVGIYIVKKLIYNMQFILINYRDYVLWYLLITGLFSFLVCYRIGPPKNRRSQNIIKWLLQTIGVVVVFLSSWHTSQLVGTLLSRLTDKIFPPIS